MQKARQLQALEFETLKKMVERRVKYNKNEKKKREDIEDYKLAQRDKEMQREEFKKALKTSIMKEHDKKK